MDEAHDFEPRGSMRDGEPDLTYGPTTPDVFTGFRLVASMSVGCCDSGPSVAACRAGRRSLARGRERARAESLESPQKHH
jgi:hypothetical protein